MMERGPRYWLDRFSEDSNVISEEAKQRLVKTLFVDFLDLDSNDVDFFFNPDISPNARNPEEALRFARVEQQVGRGYDSGNDGWDDQQYEERHQSFLTSFKSILGDFYTQEELEDMISHMGKGDEGFLVMQLLGRVHFAQRRIKMGVFTPLSIKTWRPRDGFRPPIQIYKTFRFAPI